MLRRLAVLLCLALLPSLASAEVIRYIAPGGTFTGGTITSPILAPDGTSLAPSYSFSSDSALGMYYYGASTVGFAKSGSVFFRAATTGMVFNDNATLVGESAHVLALRNSTNAQKFLLYDSYVDGSNGSWTEFASSNGTWFANASIAEIGTYKVGSGTAKQLAITGSGALYLNSTGTVYMMNNNSTTYEMGPTKMTIPAYIEGVEMTAPAAPAANAFRLYAKDNGAGKTQLCVLFSSGAEQCFATQP